MNDNLKLCKACYSEIGSKVKKCPHCGTDQRNFFARHKIITSLLVVFVLGGIAAALNPEEKIDHVPYNYGDVIKQDNVVEDSDYKLPEGVFVSIDSQEIVNKDELLDTNQFNDATNDVSVLILSIENTSKEPFDFNSIGFTFVTESGVQLDNSWGITFNVLPERFDQYDNFGAGDLMPGSKFTRRLTVEIPENDPIKIVKLKYFSTKFTVELPS